MTGAPSGAQPADVAPDGYQLWLAASGGFVPGLAPPIPGKPLSAQAAGSCDVVSSGSAATAQPAPGCLERLGQNCHEPAVIELSATPSEPYQEPWLRKLDSGWAPRALRRATAYARTAAKRTADKSASRGAPRWYARRARSLGRRLERRLDGCGLATGQGSAVVVACGCGTRRIPVACGLRWLCPACQSRTYRRMRSKLTKALKARVHAAWGAWHAGGRKRGTRRELTLMTLTARQSGDLMRDRKELGEAWRKLRQWLHRRVGKFHFALVWEAKDRRGQVARARGVLTVRSWRAHVHAHVAVLLPWVDWSELHEEWKRATGGRSTHIDLVSAAAQRRKLAGKGGKGHRKGRSPAERASEYLAKYTSKGVQASDFRPEVAAEVMDALWERRLCSASHDLWLPRVRCCTACNQAWGIVERPERRDHGAEQATWLTYARVAALFVDRFGRHTRFVHELDPPAPGRRM